MFNNIISDKIKLYKSDELLPQFVQLKSANKHQLQLIFYQSLERKELAWMDPNAAIMSIVNKINK